MPVTAVQARHLPEHFVSERHPVAAFHFSKCLDKCTTSIYLKYIFMEGSMLQGKLFQNGQSQAVRLPKEFRFAGDSVAIKRVGRAVVLLPNDAPWETLFAALDQFSPDFMEERNQPPLDAREEFS
jgi:antitoxin VapB